MNIFETADTIEAFGYWYTYDFLTRINFMPRRKALWMIWIARQYILHRDKQTLFTRALDKLS
jgi:hypothetical protein